VSAALLFARARCLFCSINVRCSSDSISGSHSRRKLAIREEDSEEAGKRNRVNIKWHSRMWQIKKNDEGGKRARIKGRAG
jgi:hypothetical protein